VPEVTRKKSTHRGMGNGSLRFWMVGWCLTIACVPALALGFGDLRAQTLLGQPLNIAVPVSLGEGETLPPGCVGAEVVSGESRLTPNTVRVRVTAGRDPSEAVMRVVTTVPIDEPVVTVTLSAGCPTRMTRTLVLLADPPLVSTAQANPSPPAATAAASTAPASMTPPDDAPTQAPAVTAPRATRPAVPSRATRAAASRPAEASTATPVTAPTSDTRKPAATPRAAAARPKAEAPASEGKPRLQLDRPQLSVAQASVPQAADAQASAAQAQTLAAQARAVEAEAAASAAQQRMRDMEAELVRIRAEAKAQTDALVQLRQQIEQDQAQRRRQDWLTPLLMAATAVLALIAVTLAWRSRQPRRGAQREVWWDHGPASVAAPASDDSAFQNSTLRPSTRVPQPVPSAPAPLIKDPRAAGGVGLDSLISPPTVAAPVAVTIPPAPPPETESQRAVTVDEQIDLEQQADFFIALGHDESAVDLLMAHLRSTGGGTPLPFLKLLEIHRRRGDREAYERTRVRFNQRFNSIAPDWQTDPKTGRSLEEYPLVVGRIQHAWPTSLDAMAELEALLFRRGAGAEMFDLPAYQELLFLYQLARDLHQGGEPDAAASDVDVLLPIGGAAAPVPEGTIVLRPEFNAGEAVSLDLDLTTHAEAPPPSAATPEIELDLGGEPAKPSDKGQDLWSDDPGDHRRE